MNDLLTIMRALADSTRLRIIFLVLRLELSVGELVQILGQSQPRVSRHVRILTEAGILERRKEGSWVFMRAGPVLTDGRLDALFANADRSQTKAFQRDVLRLPAVGCARHRELRAFPAQLIEAAGSEERNYLEWLGARPPERECVTVAGGAEELISFSDYGGVYSVFRFGALTSGDCNIELVLFDHTSRYPSWILE